MLMPKIGKHKASWIYTNKDYMLSMCMFTLGVCKDCNLQCYMCMIFHERDKFVTKTQRETKEKFNLLAMQFGWWLMTSN